MHCENSDTQKSQNDCFSQVCVCMWVFKKDCIENVHPQSPQGNGFFHVCVRMWDFK